MAFHRPDGLRSATNGLSHGLSKCPPDTCLHQCAHWCRPFESLYHPPHEKRQTRRSVFFHGVDDGTRTHGLQSHNLAL